MLTHASTKACCGHVTVYVMHMCTLTSADVCRRSSKNKLCNKQPLNVSKSDRCLLYTLTSLRQTRAQSTVSKGKYYLVTFLATIVLCKPVIHTSCSTAIRCAPSVLVSSATGKSGSTPSAASLRHTIASPCDNSRLDAAILPLATHCCSHVHDGPATGGTLSGLHSILQHSTCMTP